MSHHLKLTGSPQNGLALGAGAVGWEGTQGEL